MDARCFLFSTHNPNVFNPTNIYQANKGLFGPFAICVLYQEDLLAYLIGRKIKYDGRLPSHISLEVVP